MATRFTFPTLEPERGRQPEHAPDRPAGAANERSSARPSPLTHRVCLLIAIIGLFGPALITWTSIIQLPTVGVISALGFAVTSVLGIMALTCKSEHSLARLDWAVLGAAIVLLGTWAATELYFYPAYGTDEAAFVQYAAQLTLHGHNPYKANLLPALTEFRVPIQWATYKLDGTIASNLAYPSLSFLLVIPVVLLTHGVQAVIAENVLFLTVEMILLFLFLPRAYRALSVVAILGLPFLFDNAIGGVIVTLAVPFMIVVAYRWSDIGRGGRLGRGGVARAICLGLAACVSQYPWFVAPFVILGLWRCRSIELGRREAARLAARFFGISTGVALAVNLPFIVWGPTAWFKGVLSPIFQQAIPFGQGLIDATVFFHIGGGNIAYYTYAAIAIFAALLVAYGVYFQVLWRAAFILPAAAFYFSTRSLAEYFIMMVAIWIASLLAAGAGPHEPLDVPPGKPGGQRFESLDGLLRRYGKVGAVLVPIVLALTFVALALAATPPLKITISGVQSNGQFGSIWRIRARVSNTSNRTLEPHFATDASGYMTSFWNPVSGPEELGPGRTATYVLVAPNVGSMPSVTEPFVLQAVTATPETISSSPLVTLEHFSTYISPSYVNRAIPLGGSVTLTVGLRSPYGAPIHREGVRVALGQVIYAQSTLIPGEAQINDAPAGHSPVIVKTNKEGIATFRVRDNYSQGGNPIYFQAYVDTNGGFPYGYSETVSIQWQPQRT